MSTSTVTVPPPSKDNHPPSSASSSSTTVSTSTLISNPGYKLPSISVTEQDLEAVALVFGAIKALKGGIKLPKDEDNRLTNLFDQHLQLTMTSLATTLQPLKDIHSRENAILSHKVQLYDICFEQLIELAGTIKPELGTVVKRIRTVQIDFFQLYHNVVKTLINEQQTITYQARTTINEAINQVEEKNKQILTLETDIQTLQEKINKMEMIGTDKSHQLELEVQRLAAENAALALRNHRLESEVMKLSSVRPLPSGPASVPNVATVASVPVTTSNPPTNNNNKQPSSPDRNRGPSRTTAHGRYNAQNLPSSPVDVYTGTILQNLHPNPSNNDTITNENFPLSSGQSVSGNSTTPSTVANPPVVNSSSLNKILPLKQLKSDIELIYSSKQKVDSVNFKNKLPRETLEMHMYNWLRHRHGQFPKLIMEHASSIIRSTNRYSIMDNDVLVFGKILRNEIDEDFRLVQKQLKETACELLRLYLKNMFPLKTDDFVNELLNARIHPLSGVVIEEEWNHIIQYLYANNDAEALRSKVKETILRAIVAQTSGSNIPSSTTLAFTPKALAGDVQELETITNIITSSEGQLTAMVNNVSDHEKSNLFQRHNSKLRVPWSEFIKTLLDFQLAGHERFLTKFRRIFREHDTQKTGIISLEQFQQLVQTIAPGLPKPEIIRIQNLVDPFSTDKITYSSCVAVLSKEFSPSSNAGPSTAQQYASVTSTEDDNEEVSSYPPVSSTNQSIVNDSEYSNALTLRNAPANPPPPPSSYSSSSSLHFPPVATTVTASIVNPAPPAKMVVSSSFRPGGGKINISNK